MLRHLVRPLGLSSALVASLALAAPLRAQSPEFPEHFVDELVVGGIHSPSSFRFTPDGRIFYTERVNGRVRVIVSDGGGGWQLLPQPFASFAIPLNGTGQPLAHREAGLRDIAFDPDFATNRFVFAFYMRDDTRHNRIVRVTASAADPNVVEPGSEALVMEFPFTPSGPSEGNHNGGALEFGFDGKLYATTGDGWIGGDPVQDLTTYTGKVWRINGDGSIPSDNPFFAQAEGDLRGIFCIGLRNPYTMGLDPDTGQLFVNDVGGPGGSKANIFRVLPAANFGHQGYGGLGVETPPWATPGDDQGGRVVSGTAFYPAGGPFPPEYHGAMFVTLWDSNGGDGGPPGRIHYVRSGSDPTTLPFASDIGSFDTAGLRMKPVQPKVGPDGHLYYMLAIYNTTDAELRRVRWTGLPSAATPIITPAGGAFAEAAQVAIATATANATITYTLDGTTPNLLSAPYVEPFEVAASAVVQARTFREDLLPSGVAEGLFTIGGEPNLAPVAYAGPDRVVEPRTLVRLSSAASIDPDGDDMLLAASWEQTGGVPVNLTGAATSTAFFEPIAVGRYRFRLTVSDGLAVSTSETMIAVVPCWDDVTDDLVARWSFDYGRGGVILDGGTGAFHGTLDGAEWIVDTPDPSRAALSFDGVDDSVQLDGPEVTGAGLTVSAWIRADDFDAPEARIVSRASGPSEAEHAWMLATVDDAETPRLQWRVKAGGTTTTLLGAAAALPTGEWVHVAGTYGGANMRVYVNGEVVATQPKTGTLDPSPLATVAIGNQPTGAGSQPFDGAIDEVRIFIRALSTRDVRRLARPGAPRPCRIDGGQPELR